MTPTVPSPFFAASPQWWVSQIQMIDETSFHCKLMKPRWKRRFHGEAKAISLALPFKKPYSLKPSQNRVDEIDVVLHSWLEATFGVQSIFGSPAELHVSVNLWTSNHNIHVHQEILCIWLLFICFLWVLVLIPRPVPVSSWNILEPSASSKCRQPVPM